MYWHDHGVSGWGWFTMTASMIVFWVLVIAVVVPLFRTFSHNRAADSARSAAPGGPRTGWSMPEQIHAERYARGEIDDEECQRRLATLRGMPPGSAKP
ncbi:SHOCT domain-containing protein [Streptomyces sp. UNOB3_S3]|uniref:SHOCT domain-containing protein n=1 Tax=Streptomyces sp. UNOB3_S3 TaxID=2871682 RepID=UPI001E395A68|nr:SHOCT domain-containing protein [Streptomyces sp. UNOB3_S3]MCC3778116.1 SHOCT domain-containing protein [Streptomyces sp. UNOB3_S3]